MTNYKIEYQKYLKASAADNRTTFLDYLINKRQEAQDKRNYKRLQYYDELISEEQETQPADIELINFDN